MADEVYAYRLKKNYEFIVRDLEPRQVVNYLYQEDVIDSDVRDEIRAERTRRRRAEALVDFLQKCGPDAIQQLIVALQKSSQKHLAEILRRPLQDEDSVSRSFRAVPGSVIDDEDCYPMKHVPCGMAVIINNYSFDDNTLLEYREGADTDAFQIDALLKKLKFETCLKSNLKGCEMKDVIRKYSMDDHTKYDCFVMFIMSHGKEGGIYSTDGKITQIYEDITAKFNTEACPTLAEKPKLFFIQACRGSKSDVGVVVSDGPSLDGPAPVHVPSAVQPQPTDTVPQPVHVPSAVQPQPTDTVPQPEPRNNLSSFRTILPRDTDVFVGFASSRKHAALRHTVEGGWFITALCDVMQQYAKKEDLLSMMTRVNGIVNEKQTRQGNQILMQAPEQHNRLRKKVYFNAK